MRAVKISLPLIFTLIITASYAQSILTESGESMLIGKIRREHLQNDSQYSWFNKAYEDYKPDVKKLQKLKGASTSMKVVIYMGSWCDDTRIWLPRFFKIADMIGLPAANIEMIALNRNKKNESNFNVSGIDKVPYFIFYHKNLETGKIIESVSGSMEDMLLGIYKPFL